MAFPPKFRKIMSLLKTLAVMLLVAASPQITMAQKVAAESVPARVFRLVGPSVMTITVETGTTKRQGSAVAIEYSYDEKQAVNGTWFATNAHVVEGRKEALLTHDGRVWTAQIGYQDSSIDLAIFHVAGLSLPLVKPYGAQKLVVGDRVFAIGSPLGLERSLSEGIVSGLRKNNGAILVQTTAAISPGSSGGALVDDQGHLVAITTFKLRTGDSINFAVDAERVREIKAALLAARLFQAVYERRVVRVGSEEEKDVAYIESDALTRWMLNTRRNGGVPTYKWFSDRISASMKTTDQFWGGNPDFEIFQAEFLATRPRSNTTELVGGASTVIRLTCRMNATSDGSYQFDLAAAFDESKGTVNGRPARVTPDEITFRTGTDGTFSATINRFSLRARVENDVRPNLLTGTCAKLEERKF
jgi:S1-C subfamily serine protease